MASNLNSQINNIDKSINSTENSVNKALSKSEGVTKLPHVAPNRMGSHIAAEHGISPYHNKNSSTTGSNKAYSFSN